MAKSKHRQFSTYANFFRHKCYKARHDLKFTDTAHMAKAREVCDDFESLASKRFAYDDHCFYFESKADMLTFKLKNQV